MCSVHKETPSLNINKETEQTKKVFFYKMSDRLLKNFKYQESNTMNAIKTKQNSINNQNEATSTIADTPRHLNETDLLDITLYQNAVLDFIRDSDTPITIAFQGEWGCGKTSMMNCIRESLCQEKNQLFHDIWINTWQFALLDSPAQATMNIIQSIIKQLIAIDEPNILKRKRKLEVFVPIIKKLKIEVPAALTRYLVEKYLPAELSSNINKVIGNIVASFNAKQMRDPDPASAVEQLKIKISELIDNIINKDSQNNTQNRSGFIFFIDDLDRIEPTLAVKILEILKNIFDFEYCIFILAVDYKAIIKGLEPKFGKLTDENEHEFRSYFDKLIQLPLSLPISTYDIKLFIKTNFTKISYFTDNELSKKILSSEKTVANILIDVIEHSIGTNPRTLTKFINILSFTRIHTLTTNNLNIFLKKSTDDDDQSTFTKSMIAILICLQLVDQTTYNQILDHPEFISSLGLSLYCQQSTKTKYIFNVIYSSIQYYSKHKDKEHSKNNTIKTLLRPTINILALTGNKY